MYELNRKIEELQAVKMAAEELVKLYETISREYPDASDTAQFIMNAATNLVADAVK